MMIVRRVVARSRAAAPCPAAFADAVPPCRAALTQTRTFSLSSATRSHHGALAPLRSTQRRFELAPSLGRQRQYGQHGGGMGEYAMRSFASTSEGGDDDDEKKKKKKKKADDGGGDSGSGGGWFSNLKKEVSDGLEDVDTKEAEKFWGTLRSEFGLAGKKVAAAAESTKEAAGKAATIAREKAAEAAAAAEHAGKRAPKQKQKQSQGSSSSSGSDDASASSASSDAESDEAVTETEGDGEGIRDVGLLEWARRKLGAAAASSKAVAAKAQERATSATAGAGEAAKTAAATANAKASAAAAAAKENLTEAVGSENVEEARKAAEEAQKEGSGFVDSFRKQLPEYFQKGEAPNEAEVERLAEEKQARADSWREAVRNVFGLDPRAGRRAKPHMKTVDEKKIAVRKAMEEAARQDAEAAELEEKTLAEQEAAEAVTARLMSEDDSVSVEAKMEAIANAEKAAAELAEIRAKRADAAKSNPQLMVVKQKKSAWEEYKDRIYDTPFAKQAAENAKRVREQIADTSVGQTVTATRGTLTDAADDIREQWETSQNPMVYRAQAIIDMATEETERARAIREVQRLDPYFDVEDWLLAIEETTLPDVLNAIKNGDTASLREWLSEGAYAQQYAQIKLLQSSGMVVDPTILDIDAPQIVQIMLQPRDQPVFVIMFETSEIKCVRDVEGNVVEGDDGALAKMSYSACFQQEYDEETTAMVWKVMEIVPVREDMTGI